MDSEGNHLKAAVIAAKLRDAGLDCEIINLVSVPTSVLRRDRIVVILALALLTVLTWSYVLWLSADMSMGGMDMTGLRMIPSGMGLMIPADLPWRARVCVRVRHVDRDDGRHDDALGSPNDAHVRPYRPTN